MNRRGFKTRSMGQDKPAGLALLGDNGPASQARHHRKSGQRFRPRAGTAESVMPESSNQAHNMRAPSDEQGRQVRINQSFQNRSERTGQPGRAKKPTGGAKKTKEGNVEGDIF
jgi:hypothetical protein